MAKSLKDIHDYLDKHVWIPMLEISYHTNRAEPYIIYRCECQEWACDDRNNLPGPILTGIRADFVCKIASALPPKLRYEWALYINSIGPRPYPRLEDGLRYQTTWETKMLNTKPGPNKAE